MGLIDEAHALIVDEAHALAGVEVAEAEAETQKRFLEEQRCNGVEDSCKIEDETPLEGVRRELVDAEEMFQMVSEERDAFRRLSAERCAELRESDAVCVTLREECGSTRYERDRLSDELRLRSQCATIHAKMQTDTLRR